MQKWPPPVSDRNNPARHPLFAPTPDELRALVLDYLCHSSYTETARAFVRDSAVKHLDADGDELMAPADAEGSAVDRLAETLEHRLAPAQVRRDIRRLILSGRVDDATALLNTHFPSVLSEERQPLLSDNSSDIGPRSRDLDAPDSFAYAPTTSIEPTHIALNLRIHAFIEAARTVPLPYRPPGHPHSHSDSPPGSPAPAPTKLQSGGTGELNAHQQDLLHRAQSLYAEAQSLVKPEDRATYLHELGQVSGLLAYTDPEHSPMAMYLGQDRRESIATLLESAILYRTNQHQVSKLELYTRYTTALWSVCNEWEMKLPHTSGWPAGVKLPSEVTSAASRKIPVSGVYARQGLDVPAKKGEKNTTEVVNVPKFDLATFLNIKP